MKPTFAGREEHLRQRAKRGWYDDEDIQACIEEIDRLRAALAAAEAAPPTPGPNGSQEYHDGYAEALADVHRVWIESGERDAFALVYAAVNVATSREEP